MNDREYLLVRGRLNRADDFTPRRCGSTFFVRSWPRAEDSDVFVDTVSAEGKLLRSSPALLSSEQVCAPGMETWRLRAYVPLDVEAAGVRVRRDERLLWEARIPDAPEVGISLKSPPVRGKTRQVRDTDAAETPGYPGGKPAVIALSVSEPADKALAHLTIVYRWSERGFHTVYAGPLVRKLEIPADRLPGGSACRLIAIYSNGYRSATAATDLFEVAPIRPVMRIARPAEGTHLTWGETVTLEAMVQDPEHPSDAQDPERLSWQLDEREVAHGSLASVAPPEVGEHVISLHYRVRDQGGRAAARDMASTSVRIFIDAPDSKVLPANAWPAWNRFDRL